MICRRHKLRGERGLLAEMKAVGIDEDPVTGSAHCCLADYWGMRLSKTSMVGYQASARGGVVEVEVCGDRVTLGGEGVIVAQGEWFVVRGQWFIPVVT